MNARKELIGTSSGRPLPWPLSPAVRVGDLVLLSGQVPLDDDLRLVGEGDPYAQAQQVWRNIEEIVRRCGGSLADVVRIVTFVTDYAHGDAIHEARRAVFAPDELPAATMIQVPQIGIPGALLETEATVILGSGGSHR